MLSSLLNCAPDADATLFHGPDPDGLVRAARDDEREKELDAVDVVLVAEQAHKRLCVSVVDASVATVRITLKVPDVFNVARR